MGSGGGTGLGDILQGARSSSGPSVDDARDKLRENPQSAAALLELASAFQRDGRADEAIQPLERYTKIRKHDEDGLRQLASLYVGKATRLRNQAAAAQAAGQIVASPTDFLPPATTPLGQALSTLPINQAIEQRTQEQVTKYYTRMQTAYGDAKRVYGRLAVLSPKDASLQLQLADAAVNSSDLAGGIAAYRRFLKLAPDDPSAPLVRQEIKRIQKEAASTGG